MNADNCDLETAPTLVASTFPFLNNINVGIPRMPYLGGVAGFSSMLSLATLSLPALSLDMSSKIGAIILQGPHKSAQKSTNTGPSALSTSLSNVASLTKTIWSLTLG